MKRSQIVLSVVPVAIVIVLYFTFLPIDTFVSRRGQAVIGALYNVAVYAGIAIYAVLLTRYTQVVYEKRGALTVSLIAFLSILSVVVLSFALFIPKLGMFDLLFATNAMILLTAACGVNLLLVAKRGRRDRDA